MFKLAFPFLLLVSFGFLGSGDRLPDVITPVAPSATGESGSIFDATEESFLCDFENELLLLQQQLDVPGLAVVIAKKGEIIYQRGFGYRDISTKYPVTTSTVFRIGSVSKGFSAGLAGILKKDGLIKWASPITRYLPDFNANPNRFTDSLTISRILSHTTGYPYQAYTTLIEEGLPLEDLISALSELKLSRTPGEIHAYQNVAYSLIEKIVESVDSGSFQAQLSEKLFKPLGMKRVSTDYATISHQENVALPHFATKKGWHVGEISPTYYNTIAAGGINATIDDMGKWLNAMMGYRQDVLPDEIRAELFTPNVQTAVKNSYLGKLAPIRKGYYGLGWRIIDYPDDTVIYHEGYVNGYKSGIAFSQNDQVGICILTNAGGTFSSRLLAEFFKKYRSSHTATPL